MATQLTQPTLGVTHLYARHHAYARIFALGLIEHVDPSHREVGVFLARLSRRTGKEQSWAHGRGINIDLDPLDPGDWVEVALDITSAAWVATGRRWPVGTDAGAIRPL